ncbi:hypothetical protein E2C01_089912 [Portunus trituberculatus]|uniref:Uncharacterized protein n=1 Tax=Portunus trituberculatus TaxID=210409 RepID=A0A5B7JDB0_PORTR|nr:hypothetical protein [Portunus trituberculatus]
MNRLNTRKFTRCCFALFHSASHRPAEHLTSGYPMWLRWPDLAPSPRKPAKGKTCLMDARMARITGVATSPSLKVPRPHLSLAQQYPLTRIAHIRLTLTTN